MTEREFVPDDVPVADAVEQSRPAVEDAEQDPVPADDPEPPLESSESDWAEQRHVVGIDAEEDFR